MRTTITLEPDVLALVHKAMREHGQSFKEAVNDALRMGLGAKHEAGAFHTPTWAMGQPTVPLDRALQVAAELEDDEIVRKMSVGK